MDTNVIDNEEMTPLKKMITECNADEVLIGERISAVLEFLTMRAVLDAPFTIFTDDKQAVAIFAANDDVATIVEGLPSNVKQWDDVAETDEFTSNADPGDEQDDSSTEAE
jgi:hypothetical protein